MQITGGIIPKMINRPHDRIQFSDMRSFNFIIYFQLCCATKKNTQIEYNSTPKLSIDKCTSCPPDNMWAACYAFPSKLLPLSEATRFFPCRVINASLLRWLAGDSGKLVCGLFWTSILNKPPYLPKLRVSYIYASCAHKMYLWTQSDTRKKDLFCYFHPPKRKLILLLWVRN